MPWTVVVERSPRTVAPAPVPARRIVVRLAVGLLAALVLVGLLGTYAARRLAEREAVNDAANTADVIAEAVIQPALTDALAAGDAAAVAALDAVVRDRVLGPSVVRVKLWSPDGTVVYADEPNLVGQRFDLEDDQRRALENRETRADVSDLSASENEFESGDRLLEVYRPVWTPGGDALLFELYAPYEPVASRTGELWRGFGGVIASSLLLLVFLTVPIVWRLLRAVRERERERAALLQRAVDASDAERRRIAGTLHDGPVQELVAASFAAESAAADASDGGDVALAAALRSVAASLRANVKSLRTLLVTIHPRGLAEQGLPEALADLAAGVRSRGVDVELEVAPDLPRLSDADRMLLHRVAQECLRNSASHAAPCRARVTLSADGSAVVLEVADDGPGLDPALATSPPEGHLGLRVLADLAAHAGARLELATAQGAGTAWRLTLEPEAEE